MDENKRSYLSLLETYKIEISRLRQEKSELELKLNSEHSDNAALIQSSSSYCRQIETLSV